MRDDELAARGRGKTVRLVKVQVFAVACGLVAVAGALYASYVSYIDPTSASLDESILMLSFVLVGGVGNFRGPLVGAFVLLAIPEMLRFVDMPSAVAAEVRLMAYGLLLLLMMHHRPQGIAGVYRPE
jgi:branched-chain amino acid transport system permease protein